MHRDQYQILVDETGDGGDSAHRCGLWKLFKGKDDPYPTPSFFLEIFVDEKSGLCVRHPMEYPWNNPWNFTKDQLKPLVAGLHKVKRQDLIRSIFWSHVKRFFFCQNFQRDYPGTWKYPWPHKMQGGDIKDNGKWRMFDFADPLLPNDIWFMIKASNIKLLYPLGIFGIPFFIISLFIFCKLNKGNDEGQTISECAVNGDWAIKLYTIFRKDWNKRLYSYWGSRNQTPMANLIVTKINEIVGKNEKN